MSLTSTWWVRPLGIAGAVILILASSACGQGRVIGSPDSMAPHPSSASPEVGGDRSGHTPRTVTPAHSSSTQTTAAPNQSPSEQTTAEGPHPLAGGPRPDAAIQLDLYNRPLDSGQVATFTTPSGNITCEFTNISAALSQGSCDIRSYVEEQRFGRDDFGVMGTIWLSTNQPPTLTSRHDPPLHDLLGIAPQVVNYGEIVYAFHFVCTSEANGLTCWDTSSGRGAFMNRDGYTLF